MIVPMKKVLLLALESDARNALEELRNAGVMQIDNAEQSSNDTLLIVENRSKAERVLGELEKFDAETDPASKLTGAEVLEKAQRALEKRAAAESEAEKIRRRMVRLEPWGDFKLKTLEELNRQGVFITLCEGDDEKLAEAESLENICCREISSEGHVHYFVLMGTVQVDMEKFPGITLAEDDDPELLRKKFEELSRSVEECNNELAELARSREALKKAIAALGNSLEFQQAVDALTAAGSVVYLTGFVPEPELEVLRSAAKKNGWGLVISDPAEDEAVPVLLKENKFTRLIKPLFDFLGVLPGYREMDVAGGVLIFFTILFRRCDSVGDQAAKGFIAPQFHIVLPHGGGEKGDKCRRNFAVDEECFKGIAGTGSLAFGIDHDVYSLFHVALFIYKKVADTFVMFEHRHQGFGSDHPDQTFAAPGDDEVDDFIHLEHHLYSFTVPPGDQLHGA